jgi:4-hydroxy-3-methylbut-2-enyl diphosphate reductase
LPWKELSADYDSLTPDDVVIVPAFGAPTHFMNRINEIGCYIVDTTCGDVMKVWRRVRGYAKDGVTSLIHGKSNHEETRATASRALGEDGNGHFIVVLTLAETDYVCDFIRNGGDREAFLTKFVDAISPGFDPLIHLRKIGVANQTTMLKSETEEIQNRVRAAMLARDGNTEGFQVFDTICGATQERQDALFAMLREHMDALFVVGGYNSSNTAHLVEIGEQQLPTFFIRTAECLKSIDEIIHYDLHEKREISSAYPKKLTGDAPAVIGITAGASCPNNLIEDTVVKICAMRGISREEIESALA